jgi:hypothetical protein
MHEAAIGLCDGAHEATFELGMLETVVLAGTKCHSDWSLIQQLTAGMPEGQARTAFETAVAQVEEQEDEHIRGARETWQQMIMTLATAKPAWVRSSARGRTVARRAEGGGQRVARPP